MAGTGGENWTEYTKVIWLRNALSDSFTDELIPAQLNMDDYNSTVKTIETTAYQFEQSRHFKWPRVAGHLPGTLIPESSLIAPFKTDADGDFMMSLTNKHSHPGNNRKFNGRGSESSQW